MKKVLFFTNNKNQKNNVFCREHLKYLGDRLQDCCTVLQTIHAMHITFWNCSSKRGRKAIFLQTFVNTDLHPVLKSCGAYISWQNDHSSTLKDSSTRVVRVLDILHMNYFIRTVKKKSKKIFFFFTCSSLLQHFLPREQKPSQRHALLSVTTFNSENRFPKQWVWQPACAEFLPS